MLDGIERVGNKMPDPAILFLLLCVLIIVLSQVLFWAGVHATYETVTPPPVPTSETYYGGSVEPSDVGPAEPEPPGAYKPHTETAKIRGLLTGVPARSRAATT
jgi:aminobenzoyl-glutamate transport protein